MSPWDLKPNIKICPATVGDDDVHIALEKAHAFSTSRLGQLIFDCQQFNESIGAASAGLVISAFAPNDLIVSWNETKSTFRHWLR